MASSTKLTVGHTLFPKDPQNNMVAARSTFEDDALEIAWPEAEGGAVELRITKVVTGPAIITLYFDPEESAPYLTKPVLHFRNEEPIPINGDPDGYLDKRRREREERGIE